MTWRVAAAMLAAVVVLAPATGGAHVISDRELVVLRALPSGAVTGLRAPEMPDTSGLAGANRRGWHGLEAQRRSLYLLADASARGDTLLAERAWKSLDAALAHQRPDGGIAGEAAPAGAGASSTEALATSRWLGETCRALIAVMNSPLQDRFRWRYSLMLLKLRKVADWLVAAQAAPGEARAAGAEWLLADAEAFLLADGIFHEETFGRAGQRAMVAALALQRPDGGFTGGRAAATPESQAWCVTSLQAVTQYFPAPSLETALSRAAKALAGHVTGDGRLRGPGREAATGRDVALALTLYAARSGDRDVAARAARMRDRLMAPAGRPRSLPD